VEEDTWELKENLGNTEDLVREFEEEYGEIRRVCHMTENNYLII